MNRWQELFQMRDEQRKQIASARPVVRFDEMDWEINPHGKMKWYLHPNIKDTAIRTMLMYMQEIPPGSRSGKLKQQGGTAFYVWQGRGYSIMTVYGEERRYEWEQDDIFVLPVCPDGVVFQHFNADPSSPALLLASSPNYMDTLGVDMGVGPEQLENCPEYK